MHVVDVCDLNASYDLRVRYDLSACGNIEKLVLTDVQSRDTPYS